MAAFDKMFDAHWFNAGRQRLGQASARARSRSQARPELWQAHFEAGRDASFGNNTPGSGDGEAEGIDGQLIATRSRNLARRDLRELMDEDSLREAERVARRLARAIRDRRSRRHKAAARGVEPDLRRTLRASLARGGEPLDLRRKSRPPRPMKLVVLADVSGTMTVYAPPGFPRLREEG